jgi:hypothetical protein
MFENAFGGIRWERRTTFQELTRVMSAERTF